MGSLRRNAGEEEEGMLGSGGEVGGSEEVGCLCVGCRLPISLGWLLEFHGNCLSRHADPCERSRKTSGNFGCMRSL